MNKKSQHEIMGFVLIVLIVMIAGVIFLSFSIKTGEDEKTSVGLSHFLSASMYYTTNCTLSYIPQYKDVKGLIKSCYEDSTNICLNNGENVCKELNSSLKKVLNVLRINKNSPKKAYNLSIYFISSSNSGGGSGSGSSTNNKDYFLELDKGKFENCNMVIGSSHPISTEGGNIIVDLKICES